MRMESVKGLEDGSVVRGGYDDVDDVDRQRMNTHAHYLGFNGINGGLPCDR